MLVARLSYLMITQSENLSARAEDQWKNEIKIDAKRGRILDSSYNELAISANVYRVDLDLIAMSKIQNVNYDDIAQKLATALNMDKNDVLKILNTKLPNGSPAGSANLKRKIEKVYADNVRKLKISGVMVSSDTERYYPQGNFLAHVLGNTNIDGVGLNGIELQYNKELSGIPGVRVAETDRNNNELPYNVNITGYSKPIDGKDVVLTIDSRIQSIAEKAAQQALVDNKAKGVTIIVMAPKTGEILAMVSKPDFDPNNPYKGATTSDALQQMWRNRAVSNVFEPGSVFKVVTATAALEENVVNESDKFVCNGSLTVNGVPIRCWDTNGHGTENISDILKNSCNVGFMELGAKIGAEKLTKWINLFGFGTKTGIDLPGEAVGIVRKAKDITPVDLATTSFGQGDAVSCVQYLAAFNAVANDGVWVRPHLMKAVGHTDDNDKFIVDKTYNNTGEKRIVDSSIDKTMRGYLERVVSDPGGVGHNAFIDGYHIAGKTGTAQKINASGTGYEAGKYIASFGGMAPADDPKLSVFVSVDEPDSNNYYASAVAAPVAKQIFNDVFNYWAVNSDVSKDNVAKSLLKNTIVPNVRGLKKDDAINEIKKQGLTYQIDGGGDYVTDVNPVPGYTLKENSTVTVYTGSTPNDPSIVAIPDLTGFSKDNANKLLGTLGITAQFTGTSGVVIEQSIKPYDKVSKGTTINLTLGTNGD